MVGEAYTPKQAMKHQPNSPNNGLIYGLLKNNVPWSDKDRSRRKSAIRKNCKKGCG